MAKDSTSILQTAALVLSEGLDNEHPALKYSTEMLWKASQWADESDITDEEVKQSFPKEFALAEQILEQSGREPQTVSSEKMNF